MRMKATGALWCQKCYTHLSYEEWRQQWHRLARHGYTKRQIADVGILCGEHVSEWLRVNHRVYDANGRQAIFVDNDMKVYPSKAVMEAQDDD